MALSGRSSLERTNGRPLCPQCKAPMWSVRFRPEKAADDKITFQCPRCEHSHDCVRFTHLIAELTKIASRRESPPSTSERAEQS